MARPLREVLEEPEVFRDLQQHPATFRECLLVHLELKKLPGSPESARFRDGASLVVSVVEWLPHHAVLVQDDGSLSIVGPVANVLNTVAQSLNFTYRLVTPADQYWGARLPNGTWTGMVGQVARKEADIALGPFGLTEERSKVVDFTRSFFYDDRSILAAKGLPEIDPWGFLFPLTPTVWAILLSALVVAWLSVATLGQPPEGSRLVTWVTKLLFEHVRTTLRQDMTMKMSGVRERLVVGGWLLVAMMVTWSYSGNLVSLLAVRHIPQPIQTIRDLLDDSRVTVIMEPNTIVTDIISRIKTGELKELNDLKYVDRSMVMSMKNYMEVMNTLVRPGDHVIIVTTLSLDGYIAQYFAETRRCDFYKARQTFFTTQHCMIGQKGNPIVPAFSPRIRSLVEAGLYEYWLRNNIPFSSHCRLSPSQVTVNEPLRIKNIWGMLVLLGAGHLLALATFCWELYLAKLVPVEA